MVFAVLLVATAARANPPSPWPDSWTCAAGSACLTLRNNSTSWSTNALDLSTPNGRTLFTHASGDGVGVMSVVDSAGTGNSVGARLLNQGGGVGAIIGGYNGVGASVGSANNDALTITQAGAGHSGAYVVPPGDSWGIYVGNGSPTKPALFAYGNGLGAPALMTQGQAGGTGPWFVYSDERIKTGISDSPYGLGEVRQIRPIVYRRRYDAKDATTVREGRKLGFSAQNLRAVIPEAVTTDPATGYYMVSYETVVPALVTAIQQLDARVAKCEAR
ncbi:MAG TPA: tail fiber domain-containing protein [Terrimesophilobacter sp.]|nr:tail fiber domain-containing protein [Terrimesophilobacter sp.]